MRLVHLRERRRTGAILSLEVVVGFFFLLALGLCILQLVLIAGAVGRVRDAALAGVKYAAQRGGLLDSFAPPDLGTQVHEVVGRALAGLGSNFQTYIEVSDNVLDAGVLATGADNDVILVQVSVPMQNVGPNFLGLLGCTPADRVLRGVAAYNLEPGVVIDLSSSSNAVPPLPPPPF